MIELLRDKNKWQEIQNSSDYQLLREMLMDGFNRFCKDKEIPIIKFSDEMDFFRTGNRNHFENLYFLRREQLTVYAMLSAIYPENPEYLAKLEDVICEICNEYTWVVPAHRSPDWVNKRDGIDLFAAETGLYLAEIKQMLIDRLNPIVIDRMTTEIDKRILTSFENEEMWFETLKSNWASVCGGSVGITFIYESPQRFLKIKNRIEKCMENYLEGICDDGSTSEGASYWNYGFSFYVMYNDVRRRHTMGRVNPFRKEKVKKLAGFFTSILLDEENIVSFSDSATDVEYTMWLLYFLKQEYNIDMPPTSKAGLSFRKFSQVVRSFLYFKPEYHTDIVPNGEKYYDVLQWYIKRDSKYSFAVKGGHNAEEHNHNDIGSFIIVHNKKQVLCDLGAPEYTAENFGANRYNILNNSSLGHSVPIINGCAQMQGRDYFGTLAVDANRISIDMKHAYPCKIHKLFRNFELYSDYVILTDSFDTDIDVTERFVTEIEPVIGENNIVLDKTILHFDQKWKPSCTVKTIYDHDGVTPRTVYLMDFNREEKGGEFNLKITFQE